MGWLTGWDRRKKQTITGTTAGAQTDYQKKMTVHKGSGTDSATDVYCAGNCRDDFGDIRWTEDDGTTPMDYWIESIESGVEAVFWIEIPSIPTGAGTVDVYLYYDKSDATSLSDGDATFPEFDNFNRADNGLGADWEVQVGSWTILSNKAHNPTAAGGRRAFHTGTITNARIRSKGVRTADTYANRQIGLLFRRSNTTNYYKFRYSANDGGLQLYKVVGGGYTQLGSTVAFTMLINVWYDLMVTIVDEGTGARIKCYVDNVEKINQLDDPKAHSSGKAGLYSFDNATDFDDFFVSNFTDPEPTWGAWGSEETAPIEITVSVSAAELVSLGWKGEERAEAKATDILASKATFYQSQLAEGRATELVSLGQVLHVPAIADSRASATFIAPWVLFLTAEARAVEAIALRQVLHVPTIAEATATDLITLRQLLRIYKLTGAKADSLLEPVGLLVSLLAEAKATESVGVSLLLKLLAEAKATDLVTPTQLLHLPELASVRASDVLASKGVVRISELAGVRSSVLFATRQFFRVSELADVRATDLFEVKKGITALFTAAVKANAPVTLRQLIRAYLIASAKVSAPKTGKRMHPDHYMPTICFWYFDIDTGEVLPETFD